MARTAAGSITEYLEKHVIPRLDKLLNQANPEMVGKEITCPTCGTRRPETLGA